MGTSNRPTEHERASVTQRVFARLIDAFIASCLMLVGIFGGDTLYASGNHILSATLACFCFGAALLYFYIGDGLFSGQALGKRLFGICVVDAQTRQPCSIGQSVIRNLIFLLLIFAVVEIIVLGIEEQQRYGDRLAGTFVLRMNPKPEPVSAPVSQPLNLAGLQSTLDKIKHPDRNV